MDAGRRTGRVLPHSETLAPLCQEPVHLARHFDTTTSVGQWVTHDLRRLLYAHIHRLSLSYHTQKQTGDLISRLTSDIDSVQSFIVSSVLDLVIDTLTLVGMAGVLFYLNRRFTLIARSVAPLLFGVTSYDAQDAGANPEQLFAGRF